MVELPYSFHWIVRGKLACSEKPSLEHLHMYRELGFNTIVCLMECKEKWDSPDYTPEQLKGLGFEFLHLPVEDMQSPTLAQMDEFIEFVRKEGRIVLTHCVGGIGRSGCMAMAYLGVAENMGGYDALNRVREIWQAYIQTEAQEERMIAYVDSRTRQSGRTLSGHKVS